MFLDTAYTIHTCRLHFDLIIVLLGGLPRKYNHRPQYSNNRALLYTLLFFAAEGSRDERDESGYAGTGDDPEFTDPTPFLKSSPGSPPPLSPKSCFPPPLPPKGCYETSPGYMYFKPIKRLTSVEKVSSQYYGLHCTKFII